jgi:chromosome segregation ATPase
VQLQEEKNRRHNIHRLKQCFKFSGGEGKGTNLDEIAWLIANLKETITQQSRVIEELKASQQELKAGQKELATQNAALQTQIPMLKTQLQSTPRLEPHRGHQLPLAEPTTR